MLNEWSDTEPDPNQPSRWPEYLFVALLFVGAVGSFVVAIL